MYFQASGLLEVGSGLGLGGEGASACCFKV